MDRGKVFLSTTAADAPQVAREYGLGIEIAEFCTAWNMDDEFAATDAALAEKLTGVRRRTLHGPFNELFPCAIDRKARALAAQRYRQAIDLARKYGAEKVVIHGGYNPGIYYPQWYTEQSVIFWRDFLQEAPGVEIVLENVMETEPEWLAEIAAGVDSPNLRLCLDIGHVNAYSKQPLEQWLEVWAPYLSHFHIHNNDGSWDTHSALDCGSIPMGQFLAMAQERCGDASFTLELMEAAHSAAWLAENHWI